MSTRIQRVVVLSVIVFGMGACGGGGGGNTPPAPPPPQSITYSAELTALDMMDLRSSSAVNPAGLPVAGAVATRQ